MRISDWSSDVCPSDLGAEAAFLLLAITVVIIIIKAGFPDADDLRMASAGLQLGGIHFRMRVSFMRMNAHGRPYIGVALRSGQHRIPFIFARRNVEHDEESRCAGEFESGSLSLDQAFVVQLALITVKTNDHK